jgi:hypothetical protein
LRFRLEGFEFPSRLQLRDLLFVFLKSLSQLNELASLLLPDLMAGSREREMSELVPGREGGMGSPVEICQLGLFLFFFSFSRRTGSSLHHRTL